MMLMKRRRKEKDYGGDDDGGWRLSKRRREIEKRRGKIVVWSTSSRCPLRRSLSSLSSLSVDRAVRPFCCHHRCAGSWLCPECQGGVCHPYPRQTVQEMKQEIPKWWRWES